MKKVLIGLCAVLFALPTIARAEFEMPTRLTSEDLEELKDELAEIPDSNPSKALFDAITNCDLAAVKKAIENGADVNRPSDVPPTLGEKDWTPMITGIEFGCNPEVVKLLLENGADINTPDARGYTPLHHAAGWSRDGDMVELLLSNGADVNARDWLGFTPLFYTVFSSSGPSIAQVLIDAGAEVNVQADVGWTPLMYFAFTKPVNITREINRLDGTVSTKVTSPRDELVQVLLKNGADVNIKNNDGKTALDLLVEARDSYLEEDVEDVYNKLFQMLTEAANK